jgi:hypothetical protein
LPQVLRLLVWPSILRTFRKSTGLWWVTISTAPQLLFADIAENGLTAMWTQSACPSFAGYQLYRSSTQGDLGTLIGTNTSIADTSLTVTGLSPGTTYYFTVRALGANGVYVDYPQRSITTTAKASWEQDWFAQVMFVVVIIIALAISVLWIRSKKKAKVT